jgi:PAS domain-containing protein
MVSNFNIDDINFFQLLPIPIITIDKNFKIYNANDSFVKKFGECESKLCYATCHNTDKSCSYCKIEDVFRTGETYFDEIFSDNLNKHHYLIHWVPIKNKSGKVMLIAKMFLEITETSNWQREFSFIFERVPCYITIIDRSFKITRANKKFRDTFGEHHLKTCFQVYKDKRIPCKRCPASLTFDDGLEHSSIESGVSINGDEILYIVNTSPFSRDDKGISQVIEICHDITEINNLEDQIHSTYNFYEKLIENSADGIIAIDNHGKSQIFNQAARSLLEWDFNRKPAVQKLKEMLPESFFQPYNFEDDITKTYESYVNTSSNSKIPVKITSIELTSKKKSLGRVAFLQDLRKIRELEKQKLYSEKLNLVTQTVNGVSEVVSNIISELTRELDIIHKKLKQDECRDFAIELSGLKDQITSKIKTMNEIICNTNPETRLNQRYVSPKDLAQRIIDKFNANNSDNTIEFKLDISSKVKSALIDPEEIDCCITAIIHNLAILHTSEPQKSSINLKVYNNQTNESSGLELIFEITSDFHAETEKFNMLDWLKIHQIINRHSGNFDIKSESQSTTFTITLSLSRLELIAEEGREK